MAKVNWSKAALAALVLGSTAFFVSCTGNKHREQSAERNAAVRDSIASQSEQAKLDSALLISYFVRNKDALHFSVDSVRQSVQDTLKTAEPLKKQMQAVSEELDSLEKKYDIWRGEGAVRLTVDGREVLIDNETGKYYKVEGDSVSAATAKKAETIYKKWVELDEKSYAVGRKLESLFDSALARNPHVLDLEKKYKELDQKFEDAIWKFRENKGDLRKTLNEYKDFIKTEKEFKARQARQKYIEREKKKLEGKERTLNIHPKRK